MSAVRFERDGRLGRIVLAARPHNWVGNAYNAELTEAVHNARVSDIGALLIQAEGPNFSAGGAVREWPGKSCRRVPQRIAPFGVESVIAEPGNLAAGGADKVAVLVDSALSSITRMNVGSTATISPCLVRVSST